MLDRAMASGARSGLAITMLSGVAEMIVATVGPPVTAGASTRTRAPVRMTDCAFAATAVAERRARMVMARMVRGVCGGMGCFGRGQHEAGPSARGHLCVNSAVHVANSLLSTS